MVIAKGSDNVDPYTVWLTNNVRNASGNTYYKRLLIWCAVTACVPVCAYLAVPDLSGMLGKSAIFCTFVLGAIVGLGASVYHFSRYALCREIRYLLNAVAFGCLGGMAAAQLVVDMRGGSLVLDNWPAEVSYLLAAFFFVTAIYSKTKRSPATRKDAVKDLILSAVGAIMLPAALFGLGISPMALHPVLACLPGTWNAYTIDVGAGVITLALTIVAFFAHYKHSGDSDRLPAMTCYLLVPFIMGLIYRLISSIFVSDLYVMSQVMFAISWMVPVIGIGVEDAFTFKEASERLIELETLHTVSWALVGVGTVYELLELYVRTLTSNLGAKVASVYLADEQGENLELTAVCGLDEPEVAVGKKYFVFSTDRRPGFHTGHTAKAFTSREMQIVSDVFVDVEFVPWRVVAVDDGCAVSLPMVDRGRAIGVANIYFSNRNQLTPQKLHLLITIAAAVTPSVENALVRERGEFLVQENIDLDRAA